MEQEQITTPEAPTSTPPRTDELTRATTDRVLGGVAAGFARRTGMPVWLVRALFIIFTFAGGLGAAAYGAGWVLIRSEDESDTIAQRFLANTSSSGAWIGVALIFVATLILLDNVAFLSGGVIWAVGLLAVGLLLYTGDLPRLIRDSDDKEGVQQMTTTNTTSAPAPPEEKEVVGGGDSSTTPPPPPPTPTPTPPILPASPPKPRSILGRVTFGVMAIALGVLALLDNTTTLVDPTARHYIALAFTILGLGLLVGAFAGRARYLILVGLLAFPVLLTSPAFEYDFADWDSGTVYITPGSADGIPRSIDRGIGEVVIDLTEVPWDGEAVLLDVRLDVGELRIIIPEDLNVTGRGQVSIGQADFENEQSAGFNADLGFSANGDNGSLKLDASVGIGHLQIDVVPVNN